MFGYAAKNLLRERMRLAISIGGVAFAVMLIVLIRGLFVAYESKVSDYFEGIGADLWVVQQGTADFFHSFSLIPVDVEAQVASVDGVSQVSPYIARQVGFNVNESATLLYLVGFNPQDPVTGPTNIVAGSASVDARGVVIDDVFAKKHGLGLGDVLIVNDEPLEIQGINRGGDMVMFTYAFAEMPQARRILGLDGVDNAILVKLDEGVDPAQVATAIERASPGLVVRDTDEMVQINQRVINDSFLPVIAVILVIGFLVGVVVIGLTTYSAMLERRREYGVIKALGARGRQMTLTVAIQALLSAAAGYVVGVGLAFIAAAAAAQWVPAFVTQIQVSDLLVVAAATVVMALVASIIPIQRLSRIDPAEVFRS